MILLIADTTGIQSYVFGSNTLRDNIGASHLVVQAVTTGHVGSFLDAALHEASLDEEAIIYAGGGNALLRLPNREALRLVVSSLSLATLRAAPGLNLAYGWAVLDGDDAPAFAAANRRAMAMLEEQKRAYRPQMPLAGLGVTALCAATRLPAVGMTKPIGEEAPALASAEILAKQDAWDDAQKRLRAIPPLARAAARYRLAYPADFDHLGRSEGESSYIAVVHADGNGMGQRIQTLLKAPYATRDDSIAALATFSHAVHGAVEAAMDAVRDALIRGIGPDPAPPGRPDPAGAGHDRGAAFRPPVVHNAPGAPTTVRLKKNDKDGSYFLPLRRLIAAGDDVTFVCDGRLGLALAQRYLEEFGRHEDPTDPQSRPFSACAGVAIVKAHYPFARAYALAEELCAAAKAYRHEIGAEGAFLDWHLAVTGLSGSLETIREREYTIQPGGRALSLHLRPVALGENARHPLRTWETVRQGLRAFQGDAWQGRRNKAKALREALRDGPEAVRDWHTRYLDGAPLDDVGGGADACATGFDDDRSLYFDALELSDLYVEPVAHEVGSITGVNLHAEAGATTGAAARDSMAAGAGSGEAAQGGKHGA